MDKIDIITAKVIGNRLKSISELMGEVLVRSAFSSNIKERRDCSTAVFDRKGRLMAQAEHIPLHLGSMMGIVREVIRQFGKDINPEDVFIANDPYYGGTHLPDVTIVSPFFKGKKLMNFAANIAHHSDIGGARPGGIAGDAASIYEEGLRIPPVKLVRAGKTDKNLLNFIVKNCRVPLERETDLKAQIATNKIGIRYLNELYARYGVKVVENAVEKLLSYTGKRLRAKIKKIPDGRYLFEDKLDDDGISDEPVPIKVCIEVKGKNLEVDFSGTGSQSRGAINVVRSALLATVYYSIKAFLDPGLPANEGLAEVLSIKAPPGSIVNPDEPAAVGARTDTCQRVAGVLIGAFNKAMPEKAVSGSNDASTAIVLSKEDKFVYVEAIGGGAGASESGDGLDGVQVHVTNTSNLPIEVLESEFPLRVLKYELIPDSGGKGKYRGGLGIRRKIKILEDNVLFSSHGDRHKFPPRGWNGGESGKTGKFLINGKRISSKCSGIVLSKGDVIIIETPGGGGFGDKKGRPKRLMEKDVRDGKMSW
ncbi:MAG: hydantoinase B/oxoprolinase family protein [Actinomycetota bacterium]|nr:hydantoinase B/oxoprolinase family protein [Actinomycetota bacterium]